MDSGSVNRKILHWVSPLLCCETGLNNVVGLGDEHSSWSQHLDGGNLSHKQKLSEWKGLLAELPAESTLYGKYTQSP